MQKIKTMKKRFLTLGIIITLLIPIIQSSQALALDPIDTYQTKETSSQLSAKMLAAAALADGDPAEYELLWEPNRAKAAVHSIALSPNEQWLAVGGGHISGDNEIHLYFWFGGEWTHVWAAGDGIIDGSVLALAIDDMDGDGAYEIIAGSAGGYIYVYSIRTFNPDFTEQKATEVYQLAWRSADEISHKIWSIAIDDLDEDNIKEIIVGAGDGIHVFEYVTRSGYRNRLGYTQNYVQVWSSGQIIKLVRAIDTGDTDGDGFKEIIAGSEDHRIYVFENVKDEWSAWPPHADNAYVLKWDSGNQIFGSIQALAVGDINSETIADEIVVSAYGHGVFVFEKSQFVAQLVSTLLISGASVQAIGLPITESILFNPASQSLGEPGIIPNQVIQPIAQPIQAEPINQQDLFYNQAFQIQPVSPIKPSQPIELVEMPSGAPGVAITYQKDRVMTMTKLFEPLEPWEAPGEFGGPEANYPIDIYTDLSTGIEGDVEDPYDGSLEDYIIITSNSAMTKKPDGILGRIPEDGTVILDFGKFEKVTGGGNSAPDLSLLLGIGPDIIKEPITRKLEELKPVESIIPIGQLIPLEIVEPIGPIEEIIPMEVLISQEIINKEIPIVLPKGKYSMKLMDDAILPQSNQFTINPDLFIMTNITIDPVIFKPPLITTPIITKLPISRQVLNVSITPIKPILTTQPFLTPLSPIRKITEFQPISPSITEAKLIDIKQINPIQPMLPSERIIEVLRRQDVEIAISQDGQNFTIVPADYIKEAEWTRGFSIISGEVTVLPSYVIDIDPVLVANQWDNFRYMYIRNTGNVNIYVDTAYSILARPPAEVLSIKLGPMNLRRPGTGSFSTIYDDQDVIILGTQDGRLIFYDYQGPQKAPRLYDTYEDSVFSVGTGIWDFVPLTDSPAQRGYLLGTYPAIHWIESNRTKLSDNKIYWMAYNVWNNLERLQDWTYGEAVEIADPDGDGQLEIVAGSWDNNVYLFENIYNGSYYDAWSSMDLSHVEHGQFFGAPYGFRLYDETVDIIVGNTDGDEANEIIIATTRSILVFENRATIVNPNLYELTWRGDFTNDANYEITGIALGDDMDGDGAPEIVVLVGNMLYILEAEELYVPPSNLFPLQPILNITNPKLDRFYIEPIPTENFVIQPDQPLLMQPIITQPIEPIIQQPIVRPGGQEKALQVKQIISPSIVSPKTQLRLLYNHYRITYEYEIPNFDTTVVTRMITEDFDQDGHGEIIYSGISTNGLYNVGMMTIFTGFVYGLESISNDRYGVEWEVYTGPVTSIAVDDQDGNGLKELIIGTYGLVIFEHTGATSGQIVIGNEPIQSKPTDDIGWVGSLGVGDTDGDGRREIIVAATNVSETGSNLPRNIISVLELRPSSNFVYNLQFNTAFREPINVRDMAIGDTNNNNLEEIICSAPGGFIFSYEWSANVEVVELFRVGIRVDYAYHPVYREIYVAEAEHIEQVNQQLIANVTQMLVVIG